MFRYVDIPDILDFHQHSMDKLRIVTTSQDGAESADLKAAAICAVQRAFLRPLVHNHAIEAGRRWRNAPS